MEGEEKTNVIFAAKWFEARMATLAAGTVAQETNAAADNRLLAIIHQELQVVVGTVQAAEGRESVDATDTAYKVVERLMRDGEINLLARLAEHGIGNLYQDPVPGSESLSDDEAPRP